MRAVLAAVIVCLFATSLPASAHARHHHHRHHHRYAPAVAAMIAPGLIYMLKSAHSEPQRQANVFDDIFAPWRWDGRRPTVVHRGTPDRASPSDPRPHAWCGWLMRQELGIIDRAYNLARNWAHFGRAALGPARGVIVVWPHHVGRIIGQAPNGQWIVHSGNDGHAVRDRPQSLAGAIAFRWPMPYGTP